MSLHDSALLRHRAFLNFWFARVFGTIANQMQAVAIGWQVYEMTHSAFDLGLIGLAQFLPAIVLVLVSGHVVDRYDRRVVVLVCLVMEALASLVLVTGSLTGGLDKKIILSIVLASGVVRAFKMPAMQALLPVIVAPQLFPRALAASASAMQVAIIAGPAIGGFIYVASPVAVYATACAFFILSCFLVASIRIDRKQERREPFGLESLFAGIHYIRSRPPILGAISLDLFAVLLGGATALLPIYARDILLTGPWGLGILSSAPAVGALSTSFFLARRPLDRSVGKTMFIAVIAFGFSTLIFAVSTSYLLSLCALIGLGAADMISVVIRSSLVQLQTPDEMRGRVSAVNSVFIGASNQLGEFESGLTASWFGTVPAVILGGIGTILVALVWMRLFPQLAKVDRLHDMPPDGARETEI